MEASLLVVVEEDQEGVAVLVMVASSILIWHLLMRYSKISLEDKTHLLVSLMMKMIFSEKVILVEIKEVSVDFMECKVEVRNNKGNNNNNNNIMIHLPTSAWVEEWE